MQQFLNELESALVGCPKGSLKADTRFRTQPWWDSLAALIFLASYQNTFGKQLTPAELGKCETIQDLLDHAQGKLP